MGFIRQQEERLATRLLVWQYKREKLVVPPPEKLRDQAAAIVEEAHRIARETGGNVIAIVKEMIGDLKKK
jgi:hypothetical protein